ncbi:hypothetical protein [Streptomyces aurantiacus]|uniref:hypothetical protein n=1 Tax=Streptomyces aurantiacus TaxID=47760 RepID=UPI000B2D24A2|nr:hypothetical protein [Streptomyces aurantiacus]
MITGATTGLITGFVSGLLTGVVPCGSVWFRLVISGVVPGVISVMWGEDRSAGP